MRTKDTVYGYFTVTVPNAEEPLKLDQAPTRKVGYVCIRLDRPPLDSESNMFKASFSFCSPADAKHFSRPKARLIADSRMTTKRIKAFVEFEYNKTEDTKLPDLFHAALDNVDLAVDKLPQWYAEALEIEYGIHHTVGKGN